MNSSQSHESSTLARLAQVIDSRHPGRGGDPDKSYVARLLAKGPDAFLKKIGEEATEAVMASKDLYHLQQQDRCAEQVQAARQSLIGEMADLWFHSMIALSYHGLAPADVLAELARREGLSGIEEKALRRLSERQQQEQTPHE